MLANQPYFTRRQELCELIKRVDELVGEIPLPAREGALPFSPATLWLLGEGRAGKSTILDRLAGEMLRERRAEGKTREIRRYQYGESSRQIPKQGHICCERPIEIFRDIEWFDTPDLAELNAELFQDVGDLRLIVFSVSNPWSPVNWDYLSGLTREQLDSSILILNQADTIEEEKIPILLGHLKELSIKRIGHALPLYLLGQGERWQADWQRLTQGLLTRLVRVPRVQRIEQKTREIGMQQLSLVEGSINRKLAAVRHSHEFLRTQEDEIADMQTASIQELPNHLHNVSNIFLKETEAVATDVNGQLNLLSTFRYLLGKWSLPESIGKKFQEHLTEAVKKVASADAENSVKQCLKHHENLLERAQHELGMELDREKLTEQRMAKSKSQFIENLGDRASARVSHLSIHQSLMGNMRVRHSSLYALASIALIGLLLGSVFGIFHCTWLSIGFFVFGVVMIGIYLYQASKGRKWVVEHFRKHLLSTCASFASELHGDYEMALNDFYQEYSASLGEIKRSIAKEKLVLDPLYERWRSLDQTLRDF